jgi:hypothetical protein
VSKYHAFIFDAPSDFAVVLWLGTTEERILHVHTPYAGCVPEGARGELKAWYTGLFSAALTDSPHVRVFVYLRGEPWNTHFLTPQPVKKQKPKAKKK